MAMTSLLNRHKPIVDWSDQGMPKISWFTPDHGRTTPSTRIRLLANGFRRHIAIFIVLTIIGCSGETAWRYIPNDDDSARLWISHDGRRLLIVDRNSNDAHYFDNTPGCLCFTYSVKGIPGEWLPVPGQDGLFSVGSQVRIGVSVYNLEELPGPMEESNLNRAAAFLEREYRKAFGSIAVTVTPFQPSKFKAITWDAIWEMTIEGERSHMKATKILMEYGTEWVVQISATNMEYDSLIIGQILDSFRTTDVSNYFWPEINRMLVDIGGFSDVSIRY